MADRLNRVGQQLGNYRLIRLLGEGGFAEVYLGKHIHLGTKAAVKVLRAQLTHENVEAFHEEARTIAPLVHLHIVRVLDFDLEGKIPFLVMDYAPNGTLRNLHPKGSPLAIATIVSYIKQIADALQYAHDRKLIHRDIKPENMLVGRHNEVLVSDFGIALVTQSSLYPSAQETAAGTIQYMAPEQIQGKPRRASDQYSLGIVVYEWLTGERPFHGSLTELMGQHLSARPPSLREKIPMISSEVDQVVQKALAKDPEQRFTSVQAFARALEQASHQSSLPSRPIRPPISSKGTRKTFKKFSFGGNKMRESLAELTLGPSQGTDFLGQQPSNDQQMGPIRKSPREIDLTPKLSGQPPIDEANKSRYTIPVASPGSDRQRWLEVICSATVVILLPLLFIIFLLTHWLH